MENFIETFETVREEIEREYRTERQTREMALESHDTRLIYQLNLQISDATLCELIAEYRDDSDEYIASKACDAVVSNYKLSDLTRDMLDYDLHCYVAQRVQKLREEDSDE